MHVDQSTLAQRRLAQAFYLEGTLSIFVTGQTAVAGCALRVDRLLPPTEPPQFAVVQQRLAGIYTEAATTYTISRLFSLRDCPRTVVLHHAEGKDTLSVVDIGSQTASSYFADTVLPIPYVFPPSALQNARAEEIATGYSAAFDFAEALREALCALDTVEKDALDSYPRSVRVLEIGVEEGGVANFRHLFVRVQRRTAAPPTISGERSE